MGLNYAIIDIETTGDKPKNFKIIEIGKFEISKISAWQLAISVKSFVESDFCSVVCQFYSFLLGLAP